MRWGGPSAERYRRHRRCRDVLGQCLISGQRIWTAPASVVVRRAALSGPPGLRTPCSRPPVPGARRLARYWHAALDRARALAGERPLPAMVSAPALPLGHDGLTPPAVPDASRMERECRAGYRHGAAPDKLPQHLSAGCRGSLPCSAVPGIRGSRVFRCCFAPCSGDPTLLLACSPRPDTHAGLRLVRRRYVHRSRHARRTVNEPSQRPRRQPVWCRHRLALGQDVGVTTIDGLENRLPEFHRGQALAGIADGDGNQVTPPSPTATASRGWSARHRSVAGWHRRRAAPWSGPTASPIAASPSALARATQAGALRLPLERYRE